MDPTFLSATQLAALVRSGKIGALELLDHYIARTDKITNIDGVPPARFVIIAFDSVAQAQAWDKSAPQQEVDTLRKQSTTSRSFIVEGMAN